jgi:hypothetical protein
MDIVEINETLTEINGKVRVEAGPRRVHAVATEELLDDSVTSPHYKAGLRDAQGKRIKLNEEFDYLDWMGQKVFYVYHLQEQEVTKDQALTHKWVEVGVYESQIEAMAIAGALAAE